MDPIIDALRAALAPDATPELRAAGAQACRTLLAHFEPQQPVAQTPVAAMPAAPNPNIGMIVTALRTAPPEQLLDLAIAKLRSSLPPGTEVPPATTGFKFQRVPISRKARP